MKKRISILAGLLAVAAFIGLITPLNAQRTVSGKDCATIPAAELVRCLQESLRDVWSAIERTNERISQLPALPVIPTAIVRGSKVCSLGEDLGQNGVRPAATYFVPDNWTASTCFNWVSSVGSGGPALLGCLQSDGRVSFATRVFGQGQHNSGWLLTGLVNTCGWTLG